MSYLSSLLSCCLSPKIKSFLVLLLAQAALVVGKNFMAISTPRIMARVVANSDCVISQMIRGKNRIPIPIDKATLRVITKGIVITARKIRNPYQYP